MNGNLWWAYNSEDEKFSTLPAGPFLVPALIIAGLSVLFRTCFNRGHTVETIAGELADSDYWKQKHKRYLELIRRQVDTNNDLEIHEKHELNQLSIYLRNPWRH